VERDAVRTPVVREVVALLDELGVERGTAPKRRIAGEFGEPSRSAFPSSGDRSRETLEN
jgi:hypothetical protein